MNIIDLQLTTREAHVILRALAIYGGDETYCPKEDKEPCRWVAQRILGIINPELGTSPIEAIHERSRK